MRQRIFILGLLTSLISSFHTGACTRISSQGGDERVVTGRNMDWLEDIPLRLWKFPRGLERHGAGGERSLAWVSRFGSVAISGYEAGTAEGMNETGLTVHLMWQSSTDYGSSDTKPTLSIGAWAQFVLDNYGTTQEAIDDLEQKDIQIIAPMLPFGRSPKVYLAMTDNTGHSAVIEYHAGQQKIYSPIDYAVMTNLSHVQTKKLDKNFREEANSLDTLPGSYFSSARYQRATYFYELMPKMTDGFEAMAAMRSLLETVSVPRNVVDKKQPHLSKTIYRTVMDQKTRLFYYQSTKYPFEVWLYFDDLDFAGETEVLSYKEEGVKAFLRGESSKRLKPEAPFPFIHQNHFIKVHQ